MTLQWPRRVLCVLPSCSLGASGPAASELPQLTKEATTGLMKQAAAYIKDLKKLDIASGDGFSAISDPRVDFLFFWVDFLFFVKVV